MQLGSVAVRWGRSSLGVAAPGLRSRSRGAVAPVREAGCWAPVQGSGAQPGGGQVHV